MNSAQFGNYIAGYGAAYWGDPQAYYLVRAAGSFFGYGGVLLGDARFTWYMVLFYGDNLDSVSHIDQGLADGTRARWPNFKRRAKQFFEKR